MDQGVPGQSAGGSVESAAAVIRSGGVVAFPTDTFYGLGVDPFNAAAVRGLFAAKGRPANSPVPLLIAGPEDLKLIASSVPAGAAALAGAFWPGALTLVLSAVKELPDVVSAGAGTVGVRVPDHDIPRAIARVVGGPITGTSANLSGERSLKTAGEVETAFGDSLGFVVEGFCGAHDAPSTVVDFSVDPPLVRRHGAISLEMIQRVWTDVLG
jgi:L-threonylcarbamoyladenylate synthase